MIQAMVVTMTLLLYAVPAAAAPAITVEHPVYDFGTIIQGSKIEHVFVVKNRGDEPLAIVRTRSSCGCTAATLSTKSIPPGKSGEVRVTFDSSTFAGQVTKTVVLESNDRRAPESVLTIQGTVTEIIGAKPRTLNLGALKAGSRKEVTLAVENHGNKPFNLTSARSPMASITGVITEGKVEPGKAGTITVTVTVPREGRFLSGYLTIQTDSPLKRELVIPVYASITP